MMTARGWRIHAGRDKYIALVAMCVVTVGGPWEAGSADLLFRSAAFCCQWGTNRRPPKQVCATGCGLDSQVDRRSNSTCAPSGGRRVHSPLDRLRKGLSVESRGLCAPQAGADLSVQVCALKAHGMLIADPKGLRQPRSPLGNGAFALGRPGRVLYRSA